MTCGVFSCGEVGVGELRDTNLLTLAVGALSWMRSVLLNSEAGFVTSLDVGVLFLGVGPVFLVLRTCLFLPWMWESSFLMWGRCFWASGRVC